MQAIYAIAYHFAKASISDKYALVEKYGFGQILCEKVASGEGESDAESKVLSAAQRELRSVERELTALNNMGAHVLCLGDVAYPADLAAISRPPLVLFALGQKPICKNALGFVGPRKPSSYGKRVASKLATELAQSGLTLVSGLALGVDSIAHKACLANGASTIAVVGTGLDLCYPASHQQLCNAIVERGGTVLTEYRLGMSPRKHHFPARNRIISGLSKGVVLIEAGSRSGGRITARHAVEQSREVYAVPGPIDAPLSVIPNQLISEGAKMVRSAGDILEDFPLALALPKAAAVKLDPLEELVFAHLASHEGASVDFLSHQSKAPISQVLQGLARLKVKGLVEQDREMGYRRKIELG